MSLALVQRGLPGDPGLPGAQGPAGQDAVASSDAIRGEDGRFYRKVAVTLGNTGAAFVAQTDAYSRPQNVDAVTTDAAKITVVHEELAAIHAMTRPRADVGENLDSVGIRGIIRPSTDLKSTAILLRQTRSFDDSISYNGSAWVEGLGAASPFTVTFSASALHVTHADIGSTDVSGVSITGLGSLRPVLKSATVTATGFDVEFRDTDGSVVAAASANMAVAVVRSVRDLPVDPTNLVVDVQVQKEEAWATLVPSMSPIFWARLGEASGTSFNDEIGTNDGTAQATLTLGAAGGVSGDANTAVTFDGAQGKIAFANPALTGAFSISALVKCTGAGSVGNTTYGTILGWMDGSHPRRLLYHRTSNLIYAETGGALLLTPSSVATLNAYNHIVYTWDGTTQRIIVNGVLQATGVTATVALNSVFWLGSYSGTSTNYSFKGGLDEVVLWDRGLTVNEAQQLYVTAFDSSLVIDRSLQATIGFSAEFETAAPIPVQPPDQPAPVADALPSGDIGGAASTYISLAPYRATLDFGPSSPWAHRALPDDQGDRDAIALNGLSGLPNATSENWRVHVCQMFGIDPTTGAVVTATQGGTLPMYMRTQGEWIYVVPDDQPRRFIDDLDTTVSGWPATFEAGEVTVGNLPIPADALPHSTADRYAFVFQPGTQTWATIYASQTAASERATTTLTLTGSPSFGGFFLEFDYLDNVNQTMQTFYTQTPVYYNTTAAQLATILAASKTTAGTLLGATRSGSSSVLVTGGPLNQQPIVVAWPLGASLQPVGMRVNNVFLNSGTVEFTYENAEPWGNGRLCAITSPDLANNHVPTSGVGVASGQGGTAAATGIDWLPMIIDWDEYRIAYDTGIADGWDAAGTDLGHVIAMSIGNAGTGFVYPAIRSDGTLTNTDGSKVKQGALGTFTLTATPPSSPELMPLFNTIQRYGFVPIDKTGGAAEFIFRNWKWPGESRPFPGPPEFTLGSANYLPYMRELPWESLQFIDPADVLAGW